jgi:hypothetical protein
MSIYVQYRRNVFEYFWSTIDWLHRWGAYRYSGPTVFDFVSHSFPAHINFYICRYYVQTDLESWVSRPRGLLSQWSEGGTEANKGWSSLPMCHDCKGGLIFLEFPHPDVSFRGKGETKIIFDLWVYRCVILIEKLGSLCRTVCPARI